MKFTKEDAYKDLVAKLTAKGEKLNLSERSINEQLDTLIALIVNDETEIADFVEKVLPVFKTADANVRNDVSVGIADFKKSYTPPAQKKDPEPKPTENDANNELLQRLSELENKLKANEAKEKAVGLRQSFIAKSKELGVKDDEWLNGYADLVTFGDDFNLDERADACLKFYNKSLSAINTDVTPKTGGGANNEEKRIKSVVASAAAFAKSQNLID